MYLKFKAAIPTLNYLVFKFQYLLKFLQKKIKNYYTFLHI